MRAVTRTEVKEITFKEYILTHSNRQALALTEAHTQIYPRKYVMSGGQ